MNGVDEPWDGVGGASGVADVALPRSYAAQYPLRLWVDSATRTPVRALVSPIALVVLVLLVAVSGSIWEVIIGWIAVGVVVLSFLPILVLVAVGALRPLPPGTRFRVTLSRERVLVVDEASRLTVVQLSPGLGLTTSLGFVTIWNGTTALVRIPREAFPDDWIDSLRQRLARPTVRELLLR